MRSVLSALALSAVVLGTGCTVHPFCLYCGDGGTDAGPQDSGPRDAHVERDAGPPDAPVDAGSPDACMPDAAELCNGRDDNCNGVIDEGFDTSTDLQNCGACGVVCAPAHAFGQCVGGMCQVMSCDVGFFDRDGDPSNGCENHCIATGAETCNRRDDDCDGMVDEDFDLTSDPMNCGVCGRVCRFAHAAATCTAGTCALGACDPGYQDLDGMAITGCEYACTPSTTGVETCNLRDDDCDGMVDEGDPGGGASCGSSTGACSTGTMHCVSGGLVCMGGTGPTAETCNGVDDDCDGMVDEGNPGGGASCGSSMGTCTPGRMQCVGGALTCMGGTGPTTETCNGVDDDCDGTIDEGNPGGGASCGSSVGACRAGTLQCMGGGLVCTGATGPMLETCNGVDDDCDGTVDNGFDLMNDPRNCGSCGSTCSYAHATATCSSGTCSMGSCDAGWVDRDGNPANGCEYACSYTGAEVCNGLDDDCNGLVDDGLTPPSTFCNPNGVCAGTAPTCGGGAGWVCTYTSPAYQSTETKCDGLDNDCNGYTDEAFPTVGFSCDNGAIGACRTTGVFACNGAGTGVVCTAPAGPSPSAEACDNEDDDCDGIIDEDAPADWVQFDYMGSPRWVFQYEASRPDSTSTVEGSATHRACSEPGRLPWTNVNAVDAELACETVGGTLCTEAEWQSACEAGASPACDWSYQSSCRTYSSGRCNDYNNDVDSGTSGIQNAILPTGSMPMCNASWAAGGIYDMSGNVQEWTEPRSVGANPMRGGSYNDISGGTTCQLNFEVADNSFAAPNVGFRCCRSTAP